MMRALSPVVATISLIAVAAAAASIAGAEMLRNSQVSLTERPVDITDMFLVRLSNSKALLHAEYSIRQGWTSITATFSDDISNTITFSLPTDSTVKKYYLNLTAQVTAGNKYNVVITASGAGTNSATVATSMFVR